MRSLNGSGARLTKSHVGGELLSPRPGRAPGRGASTRYSITWSARSSTVGGIVRPSALAVFNSVTYCAVFTIDHRPLPVASLLWPDAHRGKEPSRGHR